MTYKNPNLPQGEFSIINNICSWCYNPYTDLDNKLAHEIKKSFACVIMHCCGSDYYYPVCLDCLSHVVNSEIENIRENVYDGVELVDKNDPNNDLREAMELEILRGLPFLGLN